MSTAIGLMLGAAACSGDPGPTPPRGSTSGEVSARPRGVGLITPSARTTPKPTPGKGSGGASSGGGSLDAGNVQIGPAHDGLAGGPPLSRAPKRLWRKSFASAHSVREPRIGQGLVYAAVNIGDNGRTVLYALDARSGAERWKRTLPDPANVTVYYDSGRVYTVRDAVIRAYRASTGAKLWSHDYAGPEGGVGIHGLTATGGNLYFSHTHLNSIMAVRGSNGGTLWSTRVQYAGVGGAVPAVTGDGVYLALSCREAFRLRRSTGAVVWHHHDEGCQGGGTVAVVRGARLWSSWSPSDDLRGVVLSTATGKRLHFSATEAFPAVSDSVAVMNERGNKHLVGASPSTGRVLWHTGSLDPYVFDGNPVISGRTVFAAAQSTVRGYDLSSGKLVWKAEAEAESVTIGAGVLLVGDQFELSAYA